MTTLRAPAVAGLFYPDDPQDLKLEVDRLLREARPTHGATPRAMIQPHAGYRYSGPVAASGYRRLRDTATDVHRVVILGPNHTVPLDRIALSGADTWATPLGDVTIDTAERDRLVEGGAAVIDDAPHRLEHAIEVHLPFLLRALPSGWTLLPAVVGDVPAEVAATLVDRCWGEDTLVIVSSDLSHYHSYPEARRLDEATVSEIATRNYQAVGHRNACGSHPIRGLLAARATQPLEIEVLDVRNSGDIADSPHRVVGYASIVFVTPGGDV